MKYEKKRNRKEKEEGNDVWEETILTAIQTNKRGIQMRFTS